MVRPFNSMPEVQGIEKLFSCLPRKRFGKFNQLGMTQLGFSNLGDSDIFFERSPLGIFTLGADILADLILLSGIYRSDNVTGETKIYREPYYITKNPRLPDQQAQREKMAAAVLAWQGLTQEQKNQYNQRAIRKRMSGYNLFLKEYLLSH